MRFGFREFWIDGRDFYLNGTRIFLSALPLDNAQVERRGGQLRGGQGEPAAAEADRHQLRLHPQLRLRAGRAPQLRGDSAGGGRRGDAGGLLAAAFRPVRLEDARTPTEKNGYARHAEFYVRVAREPSVRGLLRHEPQRHRLRRGHEPGHDRRHPQRPRDQWSGNNVKRALAAEAIVARLDPSRIVYHHSSGNLGSMHTMNFYTNMAPTQELDDWFEHWATRASSRCSPASTWCRAPGTGRCTAAGTRAARTFGNAAVPWEFCVAEWSSQFLGDRAYQISEAEKKNLRWEAEQFRNGRLWHRWDYPYQVGSRVFEDQHEIIGAYLTDNWRAFRTWGVSAISPWEHDFFWRLREGVDKSRKQLEVDWDGLQRPGFSPDYIDGQYERMDLAFELSDWIPTADGQAMLRNNMPLLAYIAGKPAAFTSKDHNFSRAKRSKSRSSSSTTRARR